jgi:hypothetical protein
MVRVVLLLGLAALLAGCDSYYGGAPGYAVNERLPLSQLMDHGATQQASVGP